MADNFTVTRIPELAELLQKDGTLYLPVYKQDDDKTYRILVDILGGATDTTMQWSSNETYDTGEIIEWNLKLWKSKIDNNIGNVPAENDNWTEVSKSEGSNSINYWNSGVYTINPTLTLYDSNLYLLDASQVSMPFESTDFLAEKTAGIWLQLTGIGGIINSSTEKTTPVDDDELGIWDSISEALKKVTWANIKATLKTYFDTVYQAVLVSGTNIKTINSESILGSGNIEIDADNTITIQTKTSTFDLAPGDEETYIRYTGATDINVTVPNTLNIGQPITIFQAGAGVITLVAGTGVTALNGDPKTPGQNKGIQTMKVADGIIDNIGGVA